MPRYVFGPAQEVAERADVNLALVGVRRGGLVDVVLGDPDPEFSEAATGVHVVYLDARPGPEASAEETLATATLRGSASPEDVAKRGAFTILVAGGLIPPGRHWVQTILEFAE
jgi:hypothetical protein